METKFFAILEDEKTVIEKPFLELISSIPSPVKFLFKAQYIRTYHAKYMDINEYIYTPIDLDGNFISLDLQDFIIISISADKTNNVEITRTIIVKEKRSGQIRSQDFNFSLNNSDGASFLVKALIPYINKLKMVSSWEVLDKVEQFNLIEKQNNELRLRVSELELKLKESKEPAIKVVI